MGCRNGVIVGVRLTDTIVERAVEEIGMNARVTTSINTPCCKRISSSSYSSFT